jgi:membrane-bound metal-dependent hydrolase YbcI (DUF457 family)
MPFTPLHMGAGLAFKSIKPARFSLMTFGFTQVLIDLEPAYFMYQQESHLHRINHTFLGAILIIIVGVLIGKPLCSWMLKFWNSRLSPAQMKLLAVNPNITWSTATVGVVIGSFSHVILDGIMHWDVKPFYPFWSVNPFLGFISIQQLHMGCILAGVFGGMWLLIHRIF